MLYQESYWRSVLKTISWRIVATSTTILLAWFFIGEVGVALSIGGFEVVAKMAFYFLHERGWDHLSFGRTSVKPSVLWMTGLPGSGKSTIAEELLSRLVKKGAAAEWLDGEQTRRILPNLGFSKDERARHVLKAGLIAKMLEKNGIFVVASYISPYSEDRQQVRELCQNFIEIHISTPIEECERRDSKGMYTKARSGEIKHFTGVSDPYEPPANPDLTIDTSKVSTTEACDLILAHIHL